MILISTKRLTNQELETEYSLSFPIPVTILSFGIQTLVLFYSLVTQV